LSCFLDYVIVDILAQASQKIQSKAEFYVAKNEGEGMLTFGPDNKYKK
jgi:hypothetical protein